MTCKIAVFLTVFTSWNKVSLNNASVLIQYTGTRWLMAWTANNYIHYQLLTIFYKMSIQINTTKGKWNKKNKG